MAVHQDLDSMPPMAGMAFNWVLDHALTYPSTYEFTLPLRTIYTLNSANLHTSPNDFKLLLMEHISNLPSQPCTLPPAFLKMFIKKCFPADIEDVDFDQAFTVLDYLRDLECRRKKNFEKLTRLRGVYDRKVMELKARTQKVDQLYARDLVGIRRWTLINELSLRPFNRFNCIAILNTLYPIEEQDVNAYLTALMLAGQRQSLWRCITGVEKNGPIVLDTVRNNGGGWQGVSEGIDAYLLTALDMIRTVENLALPSSTGSFESDSTEVSVSGVNNIDNSERRRLWTRPRKHSGSDNLDGETEAITKASTLERIVRGLARLGSSSSSKKALRQRYTSELRGCEDLIPWLTVTPCHHINQQFLKKKVFNNSHS
ncbi:hypothetical protein RUND412_005106 [Rhizina undulata]